MAIIAGCLQEKGFKSFTYYGEALVTVKLKERLTRFQRNLKLSIKMQIWDVINTNNTNSHVSNV